MISVSEVLATIVTFHPGDEAEALCAALRAQGCAVLVVDNASADSEAILAGLGRAGAEVMRSPQNRGVAGALAQALDVAADRGYGWLLTFDQDSVIEAGFLDALLGCPATEQARTAIVAPRIHDRGTGTWIQGTADAATVLPVERVITSGALGRVDALRAVGGFRRDLFIDFVDWDVSARLRAEGWTISIAPGAVLSHAVGQATTHRFLGLSVVTTDHSPQRLYYRYRNFVLLARQRRFRGQRSWFWQTTFALVVAPAKIVLFEDRRWQKLRAIARGAVAGFRREPNPALE